MKLLDNTKKHWQLLALSLPAVVLLFLFNYVPMFGLTVAFKRYNYADGIWNSPWVGLDNFKFLFTSVDVTKRILFNTIGYYILFTVASTVCNVALAIALNAVKSKFFAKASQTIMIMPTFLSWIAVTFIVQAFLDSKNGMINHMLLENGSQMISWYTDAKPWPLILTIVNLWKNTGYGSVIYLSALAGIDQELYEAAKLDGATSGQQVRYITLPMLSSVISIMLLLSLGGIMTSNTGLFYQVTKNTGALYSTTQTIDAYVMNALVGGKSNFGMTAAVTCFQSVVGCIMVIGVNLIVRRKHPENAVF